MSNSDNMENMNDEVKPQYPDSQGRQYADSPSGAFNGQPNKLAVTYNQDYSEITEDRTNHENTTAGEGNWNWGAAHYSDDFGAGESKSYGVEVSSDNGKNPQVERTSVDNSKADRGKES